MKQQKSKTLRKKIFFSIIKRRNPNIPLQKKDIRIFFACFNVSSPSFFVNKTNLSFFVISS